MAQEIFEKETNYSVDKYDFIGEKEITVTITLSEYRELVKKRSIYDYELNKVRSELYEAKKTAEELRNMNESLSKRIVELQTPCRCKEGEEDETL